MFKAGDVVEITEESDATGMLDFKKGKGYIVANVAGGLVRLLNESGRDGWYHGGHFKLKAKEEEKVETLFKKGQVVWDTSYGRGVVVYTTEVQAQVRFDSQKEGNVWFTQEGVYQIPTGARNRTLFFSEPKIEAATEPVFEPVLKSGDVVIAVDNNGEHAALVVTVTEEDEHFVKTVEYGVMGKQRWDFYRLGEKIVFN